MPHDEEIKKVGVSESFFFGFRPQYLDPRMVEEAIHHVAEWLNDANVPGNNHRKAIDILHTLDINGFHLVYQAPDAQ